MLFRATDGTLVNTVDLSRVLREFPFVQHAFTQRADLSCELVVRPIMSVATPDSGSIERALRGLLGQDIKLNIRFDATLGSRTASDKVKPYQSELLLED